MTTGMHAVADIYCARCLRVVGWKYMEAFEQSQKYKEGKFILERTKLFDDVPEEAADTSILALRGSGLARDSRQP